MAEIIRFSGLELRFLESRHDTANGLDLFEMTVQPKAKMPVPHFHETWDETVYGIVGVTTWRIDGRDVAVEPGRALFIRRGVIHGFRNDTDTPATCLSILTPGIIGPEYFREMAALAAADTPDPDEMKRTMLRYGLVPAPQD